MKHAFRCMTGVGLLACISAMFGVQAEDPFAGTWVLDVEKSSYPPSACPKSMVIEMQPFQDGVRYRSLAVHSNGVASRAQYEAKYDGKEVLVQGTNGLLLPVSLKRLDAKTVVATYKRGFRVVATSRREVSSDGRTMTITTTSPDKDGTNVTAIGVYDRKGF